MSKSTLVQAIEKFGEGMQIVVAIEEMSELQKALCKHARGKQSNIEEEIADVEIMMAQLELIFDKEKIEEWKHKKLVRLQSLINI